MVCFKNEYYTGTQLADVMRVYYFIKLLLAKQ